jgi:hypothetical protein
MSFYIYLLLHRVFMCAASWMAEHGGTKIHFVNIYTVPAVPPCLAADTATEFCEDTAGKQV